MLFFKEDEKEEIIKRILELSNDESSHVSTYMLSLICSQLFINSKGNIKLSDIPASSAGLMQSYYESSIKNVSLETKRYIEEELVKEDRRDIIPLKEFKKKVGENDFAILINGKFKMVQEITAGTTRCIELIHDSLAKAIKKYKEEEKERAEQEKQQQLLIKKQRDELERLEADKKKLKRRLKISLVVIVAIITGSLCFVYHIHHKGIDTTSLESVHKIIIGLQEDSAFPLDPKWEADIYFMGLSEDSILYKCHMAKGDTTEIMLLLHDSIIQHDSIRAIVEPSDAFRLCMPVDTILCIKDSLIELSIKYDSSIRFPLNGRVLYQYQGKNTIPVNKAFVALNGEIVQTDDDGNFKFSFKDYNMTKKGCLTVFKHDFKTMQYELEYLKLQDGHSIEVGLPLCEEIPMDSLFERKRKAIGNLHKRTTKYTNRNTETTDEEKRWMLDVAVLDTVKSNLRHHSCNSPTGLFSELYFVSCDNGKNSNMRPIYGWYNKDNRTTPLLFYGTMFLLDKKDNQNKKTEDWRLRITSFEKKTFHTTEHSIIIENPRTTNSRIKEIEY